ncbi:Malectin domain [Arabidopsis suecica]|uniref:non-specific serine/threonine protein kinase n=1 Tax=Arabidopsis suecica TaxID=45249 RepID=A0A8T2CQ86_ARASU|nr:Malectin domain [Arabidopsis suecica]
MLFDQFLFTSFLLFLFFLFGFASSATLPTQEGEAFKVALTTLKKTNIDLNTDPCEVSSTGSEWSTISRWKDLVTCDCSFVNGTICHITKINLKRENLQGSLPKEFVGLPLLQEIDLSRNYINGSIPPEWGVLPLVNISLHGNRLTGPIPKEFGNITTLTSLVLEANQLSEELPLELGNLPNIQKIILSSNNFNGKIPSTFAKLTTLRDFRVSDNQLSGTIPDFIQKWTKLERLFIQASGLVGPIPIAIASLVELKDLRISDLNGPESPFPPLRNIKKMETLILRNCNLTGDLPAYLGTITSLKLLDLSFNKLSGVIPNTYVNLSDGGNMLNGSVPNWMVNKGYKIDLSYNNFSVDPTNAVCKNNALSCMRNYQCPKTFNGLHINCGGDEMSINGTIYEADKYDRLESLYESRNGWFSRNVGVFVDDKHVPERITIGSNSSELNVVDFGLYTQARISAISLTYYAMCLKNGNYNVNLHFAEIMFSGNNTYQSLGRRFFDIYIQRKLEVKDFNIAEAAKGVGNVVIKTFPVEVTNGKLEIQLYWAGKGTTVIPKKRVYGPLISAISVDPNFNPPPKNGMSTGTLHALVVMACVFIVFAVLGILWKKGCLRSKSQMERDFKSLELLIASFSLRQIKIATNNFDSANRIGEGGFGPVYKGKLSDGTIIAVKQLSTGSKQGNREFLNEIGMISALHHPNLVKLYGCCVEGDQLLLVYEFVENNSLARALFGPQETQLRLDWPTRRKICIGVARGLAYLHEESRLKIVHRDIKSTNVLLDKELNPKISDFGLAKLDEEDSTHISTRIAGTFGYMAPEYAMRGHLTDKADVYSFGIVALEIIHGRSNKIERCKNNTFYLIDWVEVLREQNNLLELVDPRLGSDYNREEAMTMIQIAIMCTSSEPCVRPSMSEVVKMLEGKKIVELEKLEEASVHRETKRLENMNTMKKYYEVIGQEISTSMSMIMSDHSESSADH